MKLIFEEFSIEVTVFTGLRFDCARRIFQLYGPKLGMLCFELCFESLDQNRVCFECVLGLKLLLNCGISVAKLLLLDFQIRNISPEPRTAQQLHVQLQCFKFNSSPLIYCNSSFLAKIWSQFRKYNFLSLGWCFFPIFDNLQESCGRTFL